jgi:PleD family two-component response regulator
MYDAIMMVLAAVDDLLFSSKVRATAKQLGVELAFARTPDDILAQARAHPPSLVIFDLNCAKTDPLATIAALKADARLGAVPVIAFVSHVQTDLIAAARAAGADEVMARSAFAADLPRILTRQRDD